MREAGEAGAPTISAAVALGGVALLIVLVHLPMLSFGFVSDDGWTITANGFLRQPADLWILFTPEAAARRVPDAFRPTLVLWDLLTYQLFGLAAGWHHALSIATHVGVAWAGQAWLGAMGAPLRLRAATMAIFGLLAVHAEAVAVISFREDLLAAGLGLAGALLASRWLRAPARGGGCGARARIFVLLRTISVGLLIALACGAKASAATLPLLWWLAEALAPWSRRRPLGQRAAWMAAMWVGVALWIAHTVALHGSLSPYGAEGNLRLFVSRAGLGPVLAMSTQIHLGYVQQMLIPWGLRPEYVDAGASWAAPATLLASAALLASLLYGLWCGWSGRRPLVCLAIVGAFVMALPTSNLAAMPNMRADRFLYFPSFPVCVGLAGLLLAAGLRFARRLGGAGEGAGRARWSWALAPIVAFVVMQGAVLQAQAQIYKSNAALWSSAALLVPGSARAQALAGEVLLAALDPAEVGSLEHQRTLATVRARCRSAMALDPLDELAHLCFARLAIAEQAWGRAQLHLERALALSPDRNHRILAALAQVALDAPGSSEQRREAALAAISRALREYPYAVEVWAVAGRIFHRLGDPALASKHYARAYELAPERWETTLWTAELALDVGLWRVAAALLEARAEIAESAPGVHRAALEGRLRDSARLFP